MVAKIKHLRHPMTVTVNGNSVTLLGVGYVASALGRTKWTVKNWTKLGLLKPAPFVLRRDVPNLRRYMYPAPYVERLARIGSQDYVVRRLHRDDWERFRTEVTKAFEETVTPLLCTGVTKTRGPVPNGENDPR